VALPLRAMKLEETNAGGGGARTKLPPTTASGVATNQTKSSYSPNTLHMATDILLVPLPPPQHVPHSCLHVPPHTFFFFVDFINKSIINRMSTGANLRGYDLLCGAGRTRVYRP
jgi:hypothetical protein